MIHVPYFRTLRRAVPPRTWARGAISWLLFAPFFFFLSLSLLGALAVRRDALCLITLFFLSFLYIFCLPAFIRDFRQVDSLESDDARAQVGTATKALSLEPRRDRKHTVPYPSQIILGSSPADLDPITGKQRRVPRNRVDISDLRSSSRRRRRRGRKGEEVIEE